MALDKGVRVLGLSAVQAEVQIDQRSAMWSRWEAIRIIACLPAPESGYRVIVRQDSHNACTLCPLALVCGGLPTFQMLAAHRKTADPFATNRGSVTSAKFEEQNSFGFISCYATPYCYFFKFELNFDKVGGHPSAPLFPGRCTERPDTYMLHISRITMSGLGPMCWVH